MFRIFVPPTAVSVPVDIAEVFETYSDCEKTDCFSPNAPNVSKDGEVIHSDQALCVLAAVHLGLNHIWMIQELS